MNDTSEAMPDERAVVIEAALQLLEGGANLQEQISVIRFALTDERLSMGDASTREDEGSAGSTVRDLGQPFSASPANLRRRLKIAIGGLRSIAYGDAQTWPNCSFREVAKQALHDCGGERYPEQIGVAIAKRALPTAPKQEG